MWQYKSWTSLNIIHEAALLDEIQDIPRYTIWYNLASSEKYLYSMSLKDSIILWNITSDIALNSTVDRKSELDNTYSVQFSRNNIINNEY